VRPNDNLNELTPFVLVITDAPFFDLVGWQCCALAKTTKYWRTNDGESGAWWVPQSDLQPIGKLQDELQWQREMRAEHESPERIDRQHSDPGAHAPSANQ
jgi:hypothetical protein